MASTDHVATDPHAPFREVIGVVDADGLLWLVVGVHNPLVSTHPGHERHETRRGERHIPSSTVLGVAVEVLATELPPARNLAIEGWP